ncbi:MAG: hypothetical protein J7M25_01950 [Deltaproteobacteria bacterium]|nr:hypothetical protein [Deltaproteobacteria bacterium]
MKYHRGTSIERIQESESSIKRIQAHVRGVVVVADFGKVGHRHLKGIAGIKVGGPYASEVGLAEHIDDDWARDGLPDSVLVDDALFAVVRQTARLEGLGVEPNFRVRQDTFRSKIRNQVLLAMRKRVDEGRFHQRRVEIESVFSHASTPLPIER